MPFVKFDPKKDFVVPLALYNKVDNDPRSLLRFPVWKENENGGGWYVGESFLGMSLVKIFYVFSPSILPLPPEVLMFNVDWIDEDPYGIRNLLYVFNSYDTKAFLTSKLHGTMLFGAYRKPVIDTIPLHVHTRSTTTGKVAFLSFDSKPPVGFNWIKGDNLEEFLDIPIFVMEKKPRGFVKLETSLMCVPDMTARSTINDCSQSLSNDMQNIESAISPKDILGEAKPTDHSRWAGNAAVVLLILIAVITIYLGFHLVFG